MTFDIGSFSKTCLAVRNGMHFHMNSETILGNFTVSLCKGFSPSGTSQGTFSGLRNIILSVIREIFRAITFKKWGGMEWIHLAQDRDR
jgi:hypothetical protein